MSPAEMVIQLLMVVFWLATIVFTLLIAFHLACSRPIVAWSPIVPWSVEARGKAVLISGCDSGFGFLLAQRLVNLTYHVFALCLDDTCLGAMELKVQRCDVIRCDITSDDDVTRVKLLVDREVKDRGMVLWALVNNAGIVEANYLEMTPLNAFKRVVEVNTFGTVRLLHAFLPLVRRCKGRVVNVASQAGRIAVPQLSAYSMSKFAVIGLSDSLRVEMRQFGVHVAIIQPSFYNTPILYSASITRGCHALWDQTSEMVKHDYGERFFLENYHYLTDKIRREARRDLDHVVYNMLHAVASQYPRCTYDCHWTTSLGRLFVAAFPHWFTDWVLERMYVRGRPIAATAEY